MTKQANNYKISQSIFKRGNGLLALACLLPSLITACGFQSYQAKPVIPEQKQTQYLARTPDSEVFKQFLISQNYPGGRIPIQQWSLRELTLCALFFHPDLALSRAEWRAAMAEQASASQRPELGVSTDIAHHSKTDGNISPWTLGLGIDVPIETAGKREVRIDRAKQLSEAARLQIGQTAWQVRSRLARSFIDFQYATLQVNALEKELAFRKSIVAMLEKRLAAGMVSSIEVINMRLALQKTQQQWSLQTSHVEELRANLAGDAGLPLSSFKQLNLVTKDIHHLTDSTSLPPLENEQAQQMALLNRLDIRAALARYEAAEAKLRLEIAKQYPNITLSPSYTYDQNDHVWSLGLSSLLTLIHKNRGLIEEARALREVEAAKFEVLQANVISELAQKKAGYLAARTALEQAQNYSQSLQVRTEKTQRQFDKGLADRLELTSTQLENITALQNVINTAYQLEIAGIALENVMQRPMDAESFTVDGNMEAASLEPTINH
jgi:outer membrane protein, heavy metal efflux system